MKSVMTTVVRVVAVVSLGLTAGAVVNPAAAQAGGLTPEEIQKAGTIINYALSVYNWAQRVNGVPSDLERATTEIINAVNAAKTELLDEIDDLAAAEVEACKDSALTDVENLQRMSRTQLESYANRAVDCVNRAKNLITSVNTPKFVNQIAFAMNTVAPLALIARSRLGLNSNVLRANVRAGNQATMNRLAPTCMTWGNEENGVTYMWNSQCDAFNGTNAYRFTTAWIPPSDYTLLIKEAMRNTSYELAEKLLANGSL